MKRHRSLHPLSEHHHHALVQALEIRRAGEAPPAQRAEALRRAAEAFLGFWSKSGRQHFRQEEEILLPALARHKRLEDDPAVRQMLADHASIRAAIQKIEEALSSGHPVDTEVTALGRMLHSHVRLEEEQVFPGIEEVLSESELQSLSHHLTRLHPNQD